MTRIAIVGPVASGKTTLARRLGPLLGLPVHDLDDYYWRRDVRPTEAEWVATHRALIGGDRWIISGDYRALAFDRFQAADVVIWLDLPRRTCLVRATLRKLKGNRRPSSSAGAGSGATRPGPGKRPQPWPIPGSPARSIACTGRPT